MRHRPERLLMIAGVDSAVARQLLSRLSAAFPERALPDGTLPRVRCSMGRALSPTAVQNCLMNLQTSAGTRLVGCPGSFGDG